MRQTDGTALAAACQSAFYNTHNRDTVSYEIYRNRPGTGVPREQHRAAPNRKPSTMIRPSVHRFTAMALFFGSATLGSYAQTAAEENKQQPAAPAPAAAEQPATSAAAPEQVVVTETVVEETIAEVLPTVVNKVKVAFAPVDGAVFVRTLTIQGSNTTGEQAAGMSEVRTVSQERWEKSGEQWLAHVTPVEVSVRDTSGPVSERLQQILLNTPYTVVFSDKGKALEVRGFDNLSEDLRAGLPQDFHLAAGTILNAQSQRWRLVSNWNTLYTWIEGKEWRLNQKHTEKQTLTPPQETPLNFVQNNTITMIEAGQIIVSFEGSRKPRDPKEGQHPITINDKGTITLDTTTGLPAQLQKTRQMEVRAVDAEGNPTIQKRSETTTITWVQEAAPVQPDAAK